VVSLLALACARQAGPGDSRESTPAATSAVQPTPAKIGRTHLRIDGSRFIGEDGRTVLWRGITSFRLLEQLAAGRQDHVEKYLAWMAQEHLNVVRVLAMAKHLFELSPDTGRAQLDDLLKRAAAHNIYVEIVALADTADYPVPLDEQVRTVGEIAARHPNAIIEIANEPYHPTQRPEVQQPGTLAKLMALVPEPIPVALGAWHEPEAAAGGDFVTFHFPRSIRHEGWGHVSELSAGRGMLVQFKKPVINDEPIGAGQTFQPGRRDDTPDRFRAAALLTRMTGMGGTFHYEGGLQSEIPAGRELECFRAWQDAWTRLPSDVETWEFRTVGDPDAAAARVHGEIAAAWSSQRGDEAWVLIAGERGAVRVEWAAGWREVEAATWPGSRLLRAARTRS
jgi:hypothetical protein